MCSNLRDGEQTLAHLRKSAQRMQAIYWNIPTCIVVCLWPQESGAITFHTQHCSIHRCIHNKSSQACKWLPASLCQNTATLSANMLTMH